MQVGPSTLVMMEYTLRLDSGEQEIPLDRFPEDITPTLDLRLSVRGPRGEEVPFVIIPGEA